MLRRHCQLVALLGGSLPDRALRLNPSLIATTYVVYLLCSWRHLTSNALQLWLWRQRKVKRA